MINYLKNKVAKIVVRFINKHSTLEYLNIAKEYVQVGDIPHVESTITVSCGGSLDWEECYWVECLPNGKWEYKGESSMLIDHAYDGYYAQYILRDRKETFEEFISMVGKNNGN